MNANTCKNCKWWGRSWAGVCDAPQSDFSKRSAGLPLPAHLEKIRETEDRAGFAVDAVAADDSGLTMDLVTGPDFGCVKFTPNAEGGEIAAENSDPLASLRKLITWAELYAKTHGIDTYTGAGPLSQDCREAREIIAKSKISP